MSAIEKINDKTKPWQRRRFEKRPDEFIRDGEQIKALKQRITKRTTSDTGDQKGPKS